MMKFFAFLFLKLTCSIVGCGRKDSLKDETQGDSAQKASASKDLIISVERESLPGCSPEQNGAVFFVKKEKTFLTCADGVYQNLDVSGPKGEPGAQGPRGLNGTSSDTPPTNLSAVSTTPLLFIAAVAYCLDLTGGGHDDWRLPNVDQAIHVMPQLSPGDYLIREVRTNAQVSPIYLRIQNMVNPSFRYDHELLDPSFAAKAICVR